MSAKKAVPLDFSTFGQENGLEVEDKEKILPQIDRLLKSESVLEFFFVEPCRPLAFDTMLEKFTQYSYMWGHAAVRYKLKGQDFVVNLANPGSGFADFVSFVSPTDYLFATNSKAFRASEQYGVYGRSYQILRIEKGGVPDSQIEKMHKYFLDLQGRAERNEVVWSSTPFHCYMNMVQRLFGKIKEEGGGCADWISRGLTAGGFISRPKRFPKAIWTSLMKNYHHLRKTGKLHMVSFRRAKDAKLHISYDGYSVDDADTSLHSHKGPVSWLHWLSATPHWNLEVYADYIVSVTPGTNKAVIEPGPKKPYFHTEGGLLAALCRIEIEPVLIGIFLLYLWNLSPLYYLAGLGGFFVAARQTGHWLTFDTLTAFATMLPVLAPARIISYIIGFPSMFTYIVVFLFWHRCFYQWAS